MKTPERKPYEEPQIKEYMQKLLEEIGQEYHDETKIKYQYIETKIRDLLTKQELERREFYKKQYENEEEREKASFKHLLKNNMKLKCRINAHL